VYGRNCYGLGFGRTHKKKGTDDMKHRHIAIMLLVVSIGPGLSAGFETSFVTTPIYPTSSLWHAAISGDIVVWDEDVMDDGFWQEGDWPEPGWYILGRNMRTRQLLNIPSGKHAYTCDVAGDIVVWCDSRNSDEDIYGYNLATGQELSICTAAGDQRMPKISGNTVVWYDERGGGKSIYGYDLSTNQEFMLPPTCDPQYGSVGIDGEIVVWTDWRNGDRADWSHGNRDIYAYDLSTGQEFAVCLDPNRQSIPAVCGDVIVWADSRNPSADIIGYEISTGTEFVVTGAPKEQWRPVIGDRFVVWEDSRNGYNDLYAHDLETGRQYMLDRPPERPFTCDMDGDVLLWLEEKTVYTTFWTTTLPEPGTLSLLALGGLALLRRRRS